MKLKIWTMVLSVLILAAIVISLYFILFSQTPTTASANVSVGSSILDLGYTSFTLTNGSVVNLTDYLGKPVLLWFISTWCSTCAAGNGALNQSIGFFQSKGVTIIEVETYNDDGYPGPSMSSFSDSYNPKDIISGTSGQGFGNEFDSYGYSDIYYLISPSGLVTYISGAPAQTLPQLENAINQL